MTRPSSVSALPACEHAYCKCRRKLHGQPTAGCVLHHLRVRSIFMSACASLPPMASCWLQMQVAEGEAHQAEADAAQVQQSALLLQKALMASAESKLHRHDAAAATVAIKMLQAEAAAVNIAAMQAKAEVRSIPCCELCHRASFTESDYFTTQYSADPETVPQVPCVPSCNLPAAQRCAPQAHGKSGMHVPQPIRAP